MTPSNRDRENPIEATEFGMAPPYNGNVQLFTLSHIFRWAFGYYGFG
jgi:hypothetical protein